MSIKKIDYSCSCARKRKIDMITVDAIVEAKEINHAAVIEALNQAEKRMAGILKENDNINSKLSFLLPFYLAILTAITSALSFVAQEKNLFLINFLTVLLISIGISIAYFLRACNCSPPGYIGSDPYNWLQKDILSCSDIKFSLQTILLVYDYQRRIIESEKSNNDKMRFCETGLYISYVGLIAADIVALNKWGLALPLFPNSLVVLSWPFMVFYFLLICFCGFYLKHKWDQSCRYCLQFLMPKPLKRLDRLRSWFNYYINM